MTREACPICGHPTTDCRGEERGNPKILGATVFPSLGYEDVFVVEEDVYGTRSIVKGQDWNPDGVSVPVRIFKKGQVIPRSLAIQHGLASA